MALFLTENDVKTVLTVEMAMAGVESAHRDLALGQAIDTPRARSRLPQTVLHILQGALPAQGVIGYKAYTSNRSGNRFLVHLFDAASAGLLAVIEAEKAKGRQIVLAAQFRENFFISFARNWAFPRV